MRPLAATPPAPPTPETSLMNRAATGARHSVSKAIFTRDLAQRASICETQGASFRNTARRHASGERAVEYFLEHPRKDQGASFRNTARRHVSGERAVDYFLEHPCSHTRKVI